MHFAFVAIYLCSLLGEAAVRTIHRALCSGQLSDAGNWVSNHNVCIVHMTSVRQLDVILERRN